MKKEISVKKVLSKMFSKRGILIISNVAFLAVMIYFCRNQIIIEGWYRYFPMYKAYLFRPILYFSLIQCVFMFLSLIVYYLSIMADALNRKYKEQIEDTENTDKK